MAKFLEVTKPTALILSGDADQLSPVQGGVFLMLWRRVENSISLTPMIYLYSGDSVRSL